MKSRDFASFPMLTTERLTLRPPLPDDQNAVLALRSDPEVNKYLDRQPSKTLEEALKFINQVNENMQRNHSLYWVIVLTMPPTVVGTVCLFDFSDKKSSCEIGYELMPKFQGQGIMREAVQAVIDYVFRTLKIKNILASAHRSNQNSIKLLTSLRFVKLPETDQENPDIRIFRLTQ
ncbi:MAG: GNAT family N-acetyltransferase [Spirosomataceae bacterium]